MPWDKYLVSSAIAYPLTPQRYRLRTCNAMPGPDGACGGTRKQCPSRATGEMSSLSLLSVRYP
eukprot:2291809-Rhodomonas_salina.3